MRPENVELAGGVTMADVAASRRAALSRAPAWWRKKAEEEYRRSVGGVATTPAPRKPAPRKAPATYAGWISGVCVPGVSEPAYSPTDGLTLREQFTPRAIDQMFRHACSGRKPIRLEWKHNGIGLASTDGLDLVFRRSEFYGLEFEARLAPGKFSDMVLREAETKGLGVSLGYRLEKYWHTERNGERVRIVDAAELVHVALVSEFDKLIPAFRGARAFGKRGHAVGCSPDVRDRARKHAYDLLVAQARAMA